MARSGMRSVRDFEILVTASGSEIRTGHGLFGRLYRHIGASLRMSDDVIANVSGDRLVQNWDQQPNLQRLPPGKWLLPLRDFRKDR